LKHRLLPGDAAGPALSPTVRGMLWMAATGVLFTLLNATMKKLSHELDPWLVGFLRYLLGAMVMLAPALRFGVRELWPKAPKLQILRGAFHAGGMLLWFAALPSVSISELTAIGFAGPIFICLGAALFLNERMTGARWAAVLVGFAGVLLVLNPFGAGGFSGVSTGMLLMLASGPVFAASFLVAKVLTRHDRSDVMVLWQHLVVSMLLLPFAIVLWAMPTPGQWALLLLCGFLGSGGHYCMTRAFRVADISAVQSVKFLELVWAALLGFVMFGATPGGWTLAGGAVILASTLWLARRESRVSSSAA
jgi:drug/metabolite transporter (DMT)-like permease